MADLRQIAARPSNIPEDQLELAKAFGVDPRRVILTIAGSSRSELGLPDISISLAAVPIKSATALEPLSPLLNLRLSNELDRKWNLQGHSSHRTTGNTDLQARLLGYFPTNVLIHAVQKHLRQQSQPAEHESITHNRSLCYDAALLLPSAPATPCRTSDILSASFVKVPSPITRCPSLQQRARLRR